MACKFSTLLHAQVVTREAQFTARCSRTYANAHTYHINSISMSSDRETFLSADDLRINLWHLDISSCSFNILDIKPAKMEDLTEVLRPLARADKRPAPCRLPSLAWLLEDRDHKRCTRPGAEGSHVASCWERLESPQRPLQSDEQIGR